MIAPLLSSDFVARRLESVMRGRMDAARLDRTVDRLRRLCSRASAQLGPASGAGTVATLLAVPLARLLGFIVERERIDERGTWWLLARAADQAGPEVPLAVLPFGGNPHAEWRRLIQAALDAGSRFALATNGRTWLVTDAERAWSRLAHVVDLGRVVSERSEGVSLVAVGWAGALLARPGRPCSIDRLVSESEAHRATTHRALDDGVRVALVAFGRALARATAARPHEPPLAEQALTLVYRLLFLLYVEATGLAPLWHPIFRAHYSMQSAVERAAAAPPRGLWAMLKATSRLADRGCRAGTLRVTAYDSQLFSPASAPASERATLDDGEAAIAVRALATYRARGRPSVVRFDYADLGVEQLGAIYERVLEDWPLGSDRAADPPDKRHAAVSARKATSSFYTPAAITAFLVRRTLAPLMSGRTSDDILTLRVLDPAMGSGAFLVGACRYIAQAYEAALVHEGRVRPGDLTEADRGGFRRLVAQRCLYGVDLNPRAVELARLSLWLTTLAGTKPLTFLDHRLRCGNSLLGARLADLARAPSPGRLDARGAPTLPLDDLGVTLPGIVRVRHGLARQPELTPGDVAAKQRQLAALDGEGGLRAAWRAMADAWVSAWFWDDGSPPPRGASYRAYGDHWLGRASGLGPDTCEAIRRHTEACAAALRYFHWDLEFPEVYFDEDGAWRERAGFDAVLGNPPWDMLRADDGRTHGPAPPALVVRYARESGRFPHCRQGHANQYQLFVDRVLDLVAPDGRLGLVVPWGLLADAGSGPLRHALFARHTVDGVVSFDNRHGLFPIHRGVRFAVFTAAKPRAHAMPADDAGARLVPARLGLTTTTPLDAVPDAGGDRTAWPLTLSLGWLRLVSGPDLSVPDVRDEVGARLLERLAVEHPRLGDSTGYGARFGRELNASDDRALFNGAARGWPVLDGKDVHPFRVERGAARRWIDAAALDRRPRLAERARRPRLAYRDVASPTNQLTLIAAVLPSSTLSTHTLFCLDPREDDEPAWVLCALLNSLLANYLVRRRVSSHVTTAIVEALPLPWVVPGSAVAKTLASLARRLSGASPRGGAALFESRPYIALQREVLRLSRLTPEETACVLSDFPLLPATALEAIRNSPD